MIDWSQRKEHLQFAESLIGAKFDPAQVTWLASVEDSGKLLGVVVYGRKTEQNCEMSVAAASPRFLSRKNLEVFFGYPFWQLGCTRVTAVVSADNRHSYEFVRRLGFQVEGILRHWFKDSINAIVLGMLREECKWVKVHLRHHKLQIL